MGQLRTIRKGMRYNAVAPEGYEHPKFGLSDLIPVSSDGVDFWLKWLVSLDTSIIKAKEIPIVTNPILMLGTVQKGTYYVLPIAWQGVYFHGCYGDIANNKTAPKDYITIAELKKREVEDIVFDDGRSGETGSGETGSSGTDTVSVPIFGDVPMKNIYIAIGIGFLLLLLVNKK
jgi:hypothetical protein